MARNIIKPYHHEYYYTHKKETMVILIVILLSLALGIYIGIRIGKYFIQKEIVVIRNQNMLLQQYANQWASAARNSQELTNEVAEHHTRHTTTSLQTVLQLLGRIEQEKTHQQDTEEKEKIQRLITQVKDIQKKN